MALFDCTTWVHTDWHTLWWGWCFYSRNIIFEHFKRRLVEITPRKPRLTRFSRLINMDIILCLAKWLNPTSGQPGTAAAIGAQRAVPLQGLEHFKRQLV